MYKNQTFVQKITPEGEQQLTPAEILAAQEMAQVAFFDTWWFISNPGQNERERKPFPCEKKLDETVLRVIVLKHSSGAQMRVFTDDL